MLQLVLVLSLAQAPATEPAPTVAPPLPAAQPVLTDEGEAAEASPEGVPPMDLVPTAPEDTAVSPEALKRKASGQPSVTTRVLLSGTASVAASFGGMGLALALTGANPALDTNFAVAALSPILIAGVGYAVHSALGGRGEPILAYLLALSLMAGAAGLASAIDGTNPATPILTTLIGTLPAAAGAIFVLEFTTKKSRRAPQVALLPTGVSAVF
ncbi:MAG: hypothetical protein AMXMBFR34_36980 [Myxococcaceae bacterium]